MANWDAENEVPEFRGGIWRLNIADDAKGRGVGRFAVEAVADEARRRGFSRITVLWDPAPDGPQGFYLKVGFRVVGELFGLLLHQKQTWQPSPRFIARSAPRDVRACCGR